MLWPGEQAEKVVLDAIGVLIFVDVNVLKTLLPAFADGGRIFQKFCGAKKKIVEIERVTLRKQLFVRFEDVGHFAAVGAESFGADLCGRLAVIFGMADFAEDIARGQSLVGDIQARHRQLDGG